MSVASAGCGMWAAAAVQEVIELPDSAACRMGNRCLLTGRFYLFSVLLFFFFN